MSHSLRGFPVSRALGKEKPGNRPKPSAGIGSPTHPVSSRIDHSGKLPKCLSSINEETPLVEKPASSRETHRNRPSRIDPALKSWLDNVIIPSLVRRYLLEREESKGQHKPRKPTLAIQPGSVYARHDSERKL
jgi:hypothetical protein